MRIVNLQQGTPEWLAHRRTTHNASDAPAMMGLSPYVTRTALVRRVATGIEPEVDSATQARFDRGHAVEPALRALAESIIGEDLFPVTATTDDGYLGASFDGVTLDESTIFEGKQFNAAKVADVQNGVIPQGDYWQIVQQFAVCTSAERCLYLVGDGGKDTARLWIDRAQVEDQIPKLIAAWRQFDADVAAYEPEVDAPAAPAVGQAPDALPTLSVVARGMVEHSNHREFRDRALAAIAAVNRDLQTDEDFATAELTVKAFRRGEEMLEATRQQILGQMADVNDVMQTIDQVQEELRRTRLDLDKLVTREKENRKAEIVRAGVESVRQHYAAINSTLGEFALAEPATLQSLIASAIKGKRTVATIRDAVDGAVVQAKIDASQVAERVRQCVAVLGEFADHAQLFPDRVQLCAVKDPADLRNLAAARVAEHRQKLDAERDRIRQEEREAALREQQAANQNTPGDDASAAAEPTTTAPVGGPTSIPQAAGAAPMPAAAADQWIKLGEFSELITPLSITAEGLKRVGCTPIRKGAAKLYRVADLQAACETLARVITEAPMRAARRIQQREAA